MLTRSIALISVAVIVGCSNENSELAALDAFYKSGDPKAATCAQYTALVGEAHDALGPSDPPEMAAKKLQAKYSQRVSSPDDQARLTRMMTGVAMLAYGLRALSRDGAIIAHMQMCRQQASGDSPAISDSAPAAIDRKMRVAEGCEKNFPVGPKRKDCVARAFGSQT
jgi:hypothetical protein